MKNRFAYILDVFFTTFITFILSLVLFNFFTPYPYSILFSACASALALILFLAVNTKRRKQQQLDKQTQKEISALISELNFSTKQEQYQILANALKTAQIAYEKRQSALIVKDKKAVLFSKFSFNKITKSDIVRAFNIISHEEKVYVFAENFEPEVVAFAERFSGRVNLVDGKKLYAFLKQNSAIPKSYKYSDFYERKNKGSFKNLLDKKKAKTFLAFGTLFLLFSYISPLKVYYIVCGCSFLVYSLVLRLYGKDFKIKDELADNIL